MKPSSKIKILKWGDRGSSRSVEDQVAREEPMEIRVNGKSLSVTMRTPGHDGELAAGFLFTEGLLRTGKDLLEIVACRNPQEGPSGNILHLFLAPSAKFDPRKLKRHFYVSSSCGVCGKTSIDQVRRKFKSLKSNFKISRKVLLGLPARLRLSQETFEKTGGLHASALFDAKGNLEVLREDVGRHNALDKVAGWGFLEGRLPFGERVLLVSGRVSFEIMQKALALGIPLVAAIGAPSSLAVSFAKESGQTLVGFMKEKGMNVYAHGARIRQ